MDFNGASHNRNFGTMVRYGFCFCDPPTMMILEQINQEKQFIIYRISETDVLVKEGAESWLEEEVTIRLERAESGNAEDLLRWKDKE